MEYLTDVKVDKIYRGPDGIGEYGPWQILNIYFDGHGKKKFSWFESDDRNPVPGDVLKVVGYEESTKQGKDGKTYTNRNIKQLEFATPKAAPGTAPQKSDNTPNTITMYVSYVKDVVVAKINNGNELQLNQAVDLIATESRRLYDLVEGGKQEAPSKSSPPHGYDIPPDEHGPPPPIDDNLDDIPF